MLNARPSKFWYRLCGTSSCLACASVSRFCLVWLGPQFRQSQNQNQIGGSFRIGMGWGKRLKDRSTISTTSSSTSTYPRYGRGCLLRTSVHTCKYTCRLGQMKTKEGACRTGPCYTMSSWIGIPFPRGPKANFGDHRNRYILLHQMYLQASFSFQPGSNELGPSSPSPPPPKRDEQKD